MSAKDGESANAVIPSAQGLSAVNVGFTGVCMTRIGATFEKLRSQGEKALVTFITAGDPDLVTTHDMILAMEEAGADIIELGVPFSDPMADGPTIQKSSERALAAGTSLHGILETVRKVRKQSQVPILLMGYYNPLFIYGIDKFTADAAACGVDGLLIVDLPPEEAGELKKSTDQRGLDLIFLLTPTSDDSRIAKVTKMARGFIYYVSVTGVTGARERVSASVGDMVARITCKTSIPVVVGFGISTAEQAREVAGAADGVVVGSAIVKVFAEQQGELLKQRVSELVKGLKKGVMSVSHGSKA